MLTTTFQAQETCLDYVSQTADFRARWQAAYETNPTVALVKAASCELCLTGTMTSSSD